MGKMIWPDDYLKFCPWLRTLERHGIPPTDLRKPHWKVLAELQNTEECSVAVVPQSAYSKSVEYLAEKTDRWGQREERPIVYLVARGRVAIGEAKGELLCEQLYVEKDQFVGETEVIRVLQIRRQLGDEAIGPSHNILPWAWDAWPSSNALGRLFVYPQRMWARLVEPAVILAVPFSVFEIAYQRAQFRRSLQEDAVRKEVAWFQPPEVTHRFQLARAGYALYMYAVATGRLRWKEPMYFFHKTAIEAALKPRVKKGILGVAGWKGDVWRTKIRGVGASLALQIEKMACASVPDDAVEAKCQEAADIFTIWKEENITSKKGKRLAYKLEVVADTEDGASGS